MEWGKGMMGGGRVREDMKQKREWESKKLTIISTVRLWERLLMTWDISGPATVINRNTQFPIFFFR